MDGPGHLGIRGAGEMGAEGDEAAGLHRHGLGLHRRSLRRPRHVQGRHRDPGWIGEALRGHVPGAICLWGRVEAVLTNPSSVGSPDHASVRGPGHRRGEQRRPARRKIRSPGRDGDPDAGGTHYAHHGCRGSAGIGDARRYQMEGAGARRSRVVTSSIDRAALRIFRYRPRHARVRRPGHRRGELLHSAGRKRDCLRRHRHRDRAHGNGSGRGAARISVAPGGDAECSGCGRCGVDAVLIDGARVGGPDHRRVRRARHRCGESDGAASHDGHRGRLDRHFDARGRRPLRSALVRTSPASHRDRGAQRRPSRSPPGAHPPPPGSS